MLSARKTMDVVSAFYDVGSYRGAAEICGVDPKTVKRIVLAHEAGELDESRRSRMRVAKNTDVVRDLVAKRVDDTKTKVTAKRLLPEARAAGYLGSDRNFRRLVAGEKKGWRAKNAYQRRPGVWVLRVLTRDSDVPTDLRVPAGIALPTIGEAFGALGASLGARVYTSAARRRPSRPR